MTDVTLLPGQFDLDGALQFGWNLDVTTTAPKIGDAAIIDQDTAQDQADGNRAGRDYRGPRTLSFDLATTKGVDGASADVLGERVEAAWLADKTRLSPGRWSVLRYNKSGTTKRVYGRPRKIAPVVDFYYVGRIEYSAEYVTRDHLFFEDELRTVDVSIIPPQSGGLVSPVVSPVTTVAESEFQGQFTVGGSVSTPIATTIYGPITNPKVEFIGQWKFSLNGSLASDDWVTIDPYAGTVLTKFGANWAGRFTADSPTLQQMTLPPGATTLVLRGTDGTGTARVQGAWRNASSSF